MRRLRSSVLFLALAAVCLPQTATDYVTADIRRVGERLACKCGSCNNSVGTCPMLQCHYALPAKERIAEMQKAGNSDDQIVNTFVKEMGIVALAHPPEQGFNRLGILMPFIALLMGLAVVIFYLRRRRPAPVQEVPPVDLAVRDRYAARIEKELADLD